MKPPTDSCSEGVNEFESARLQIEDDIRRDPFVSRFDLWELQEICAHRCQVSRTNIGRRFKHLTEVDCQALLKTFEPQSADIERRCAELEANPPPPPSAEELGRTLAVIRQVLGDRYVALVRVAGGQYAPIDNIGSEEQN